MNKISLPVGPVEIAPHVHNARYACPLEFAGRDEFQFISGYEECGPRYKVSRSSYTYLTLEMIISGSGHLTLNREKFAVGAGFCFCAGPQTEYSLRSDPDAPLVKYFLAFGKTPSGKTSSQKYLHPGFHTQYVNPQDLRKWNELILDEGASQSPNAVQNTADLIGILVRKIAPEASSETPSKATDALVERAIKTIERKFKELSSLQELADALSVSSEHLCRVFKANNKASPYQILSRRKMEHAYAQLKMTKTPIQDIAQSLGFTDAFHFSRAFKKRYRLPPSKLR